MADSSDIDNAIVAKLGADATLLTYVPNGVYIDEAKSGMTKFVIVSLVDEVDEPVFGKRAFEDALYQVEARILHREGEPLSDIRAAAARIDALLEDQLLTVAGYAWMTCHRESRIRLTEVDDVDSSIRWFRRGGNYRVQMSLP
jgi:hypothetical protein